jgi:hypothetical protein
MAIVRNVLRVIAEYFTFFIGFLFIFVIGALYAFLHVEGLLINIIFLAIVLGWIVYLIKSFWDLLEKKNNGEDDQNDIQVTIEDDNYEKKDTNMTK